MSRIVRQAKRSLDINENSLADPQHSVQFVIWQLQNFSPKGLVLLTRLMYIRLIARFKFCNAVD